MKWGSDPTAQYTGGFTTRGLFRSGPARCSVLRPKQSPHKTNSNYTDPICADPISAVENAFWAFVRMDKTFRNVGHHQKVEITFWASPKIQNPQNLLDILTSSRFGGCTTHFSFTTTQKTPPKSYLILVFKATN